VRVRVVESLLVDFLACCSNESKKKDDDCVLSRLLVNSSIESDDYIQVRTEVSMSGHKRGKKGNRDKV
jgi:hypothetical protein